MDNDNDDVYRDIAELSGGSMHFVEFTEVNAEYKALVTECVTCKFQCVEDEIVDQSRWTTTSRETYKHVESGRYFQRYHSYGSTESQDGQEYDDNDDWAEVYPTEVTVIQYVEKEAQS
jgi:hypothetical protein